MKTTHERFMSKVKVSDTGCWEWQASTFSNGYGQFKVANKTFRSHRWSYQHYLGAITDGMFVCHKCDNKRCVNPDHLFLGNQQDNMDDMKSKGRQSLGVRNNRAILNEETVRLIKQFLVRHPVQMGRNGGQCNFLSRWFGIHRVTITNISAGYNWKHIK